MVGISAKLKPSRGGALVVLGLIVFGLLIVGGLYVTPHPKTPQPPAGAVLGAPASKVRFATYDLARQYPRNDPLLASIVKLEPDYVLLHGVNEDDAMDVADLLGMQRFYHTSFYRRSERIGGRRATWGNLILSKHPLYVGSPIGGKYGGFGVWVASVVDNKEFFIADLHLNPGGEADAEAGEFAQFWKSQGSPPLITAAMFSNSASMSFLNSAGNFGGEAFYVSSHWEIVGTGAASSSTGVVPRWIDVKAKP